MHGVKRRPVDLNSAIGSLLGAVLALVIFCTKEEEYPLETVGREIDSRLSLPYQVGDDVVRPAPAKSAGDARYASQDPFIHGNQRCPTQS